MLHPPVLPRLYVLMAHRAAVRHCWRLRREAVLHLHVGVVLFGVDWLLALGALLIIPMVGAFIQQMGIERTDLNCLITLTTHTYHLALQ